MSKFIHTHKHVQCGSELYIKITLSEQFFLKLFGESELLNYTLVKNLFIPFNIPVQKTTLLPVPGSF